MNNSRSVVVRMADGTRKAAVTLPTALTVGQLLQTTQQKWNLPDDADYAVRLESTAQQLDPTAILGVVGIQDNDLLEIYPILEAGQK